MAVLSDDKCVGRRDCNFLPVPGRIVKTHPSLRFGGSKG